MTSQSLIDEPFSMTYRLLYSVALVLIVVEGQGQGIQQEMFVCSPKSAENTTLSTTTKQSVLQCIAVCAGNSECKSVSACGPQENRMKCSLSSDWPIGDCDTSDQGNCRSFKRANPCQNGGTLNDNGVNCTCVASWYNTFCQRYRYDCIEFDATFGVTMVQPRWYDKPFIAVCPNQRNNMGGVFQPKLDPGDLNRTYEDYKNGFSLSVTKGGWKGLEYFHAMTRQGYYRFSILLNAVSKPKVYYDGFFIHGEDEGYKFSYDTFRADLSDFADGFAENNETGAGSLQGLPFSAYDKDPYGCAALHGAGWWYDENCGPVLIWDSETQRGKWPKTNSSVDVIPTMVFHLELLYFYDSP